MVFFAPEGVSLKDFEDDIDSERYNSEEYYKSILTEEDIRQDKKREESELRKFRIDELISDLSKGRDLVYETESVKIVYSAIKGNIEQTITYKKESLNPEDGGIILKGTVESKKGKDAVCDMLRTVVIDRLYGENGKTIYRKDSDLFLRERIMIGQ